jgi:hypothetical protein
MPKPTFELTIAGLIAVGLDSKHQGGAHADTMAIVPPGTHKPRLAVRADNISKAPKLPFLSVVAPGGEGWAVFDVTNLAMRINPTNAAGYERDPVGFSTVGVSSKVATRGESDTSEWDDLGYVANLSWCGPRTMFKGLNAAPRIASLLLDRGELRSLRPTSQKVKEVTWKFNSGQKQQVVDGMFLKYKPLASEKVRITFTGDGPSDSLVLTSRSGLIQASFFALCDGDRVTADDGTLDLTAFQPLASKGALKAPSGNRIGGVSLKITDRCPPALLPLS